ncbi:MAG: AraC family transcriptional regulator [Acidimicrobiales bacterium]
MSPNRHAARPAVSAGLGLRAGFRLHSHPAHQLTWTRGAPLHIRVGDSTWVLGRATALWIPAGTRHEVTAAGDTTMLSLYFLPERCPVRWSAVAAVHTGGLLGHLLDHLLDLTVGAPRRRAEGVLFDILQPASATTVRIPFPQDDRFRRITAALQANPADARTLDDWGRAVGASARTLSRVIERETGMGFARWRAHLRIAHATHGLASGRSVAQVAHDVGFANPSAFIAAFRRVVGATPSAYVAQRTRSGDRSRCSGSHRDLNAVLDPGKVIDVRGDFVFT